jgi:arylsulfatase A-like enzyme
MIVIDDLRSERVSVNERPHMDALAKRGVSFSRCYAQYALCSPSRTSVLTGTRPDTTSVSDLTTHFRDTVPSIVTLPEQFRRFGYTTFGAGKIYHRGLGDASSWSEPPPSSDRPNYALPANLALDMARKARSRAAGIMTGGKVKRGPVLEASPIHSKFHDEVVADIVIDRLRLEARRPSDAPPFFIAAGFVRPHLPFVAPRQFFELFDPRRREDALRTIANGTHVSTSGDYVISSEAIPLPDHPRHPRGDVPSFVLAAGAHELLSYYGVPSTIRELNSAHEVAGGVPTAPFVASEAEAEAVASAEEEYTQSASKSVRHGRASNTATDQKATARRVQLRHAYAAAVAYTDHQIGRLMNVMDDHDLWGNTFVVLWSDHGFKIGEHGGLS